VHGPIAVGECLTCHLPHESKFERLLKSKDNKACFDCHNEGDLAKIEQHEEKTGRTCLSCHLPHAADNRFFLVKK
jgi:predicted CXXCH cytochrome family protein